MSAAVDKGPVLEHCKRLFLRKDIASEILHESNLYQHYQDGTGKTQKKHAEEYVYVDGVVELYGVGDLEVQHPFKAYAKGLFQYVDIDAWFGKSIFDKRRIQIYAPSHLDGEIALPPSIEKSKLEHHYPATTLPLGDNLTYFDVSQLHHFATEWLGFPSDEYWKRVRAQIEPHMPPNEEDAATKADKNEIHPKERKTLESLVSAMDSLLLEAGILDSKPFTAGQQLEAQMRSLGIPNPPKAKTLGEKVKAIRQRQENSK
ncbi:MAG: hypothetical protein CL547_03070 [Alcanivorax sp.]|nr:hypothetical protein [Alcanivorax sp.]